MEGRVVFRYKPILGRLSPTATIGLHLNETWWRVDAYVDSGAALRVTVSGFQGPKVLVRPLRAVGSPMPKLGLAILSARRYPHEKRLG